MRDPDELPDQQPEDETPRFGQLPVDVPDDDDDRVPDDLGNFA
jgi:hypothetical protein